MNVIKTLTNKIKLSTENKTNSGNMFTPEIMLLVSHLFKASIIHSLLHIHMCIYLPVLHHKHHSYLNLPSSWLIFSHHGLIFSSDLTLQRVDIGSEVSTISNLLLWFAFQKAHYSSISYLAPVLRLPVSWFV